MRIDIHAHYGIIPGGYQMPLESQLHAMKKYGVDYALISNIECGLLHKGNIGNIEMLNMVRAHTDRLGCMLWCCENLTDNEREQFENIYIQNQDVVKGLKIHPDISGERVDAMCFDFFYEMGAKYNLPILLHTKNNGCSDVKYAVHAAEKFSKTKLILGHMGMTNDGKEALKAVEQYENVYGDTAWVPFEVTVQAIEMGIGHACLGGKRHCCSIYY